MTKNMKATFQWLRDNGFMMRIVRFPSIASVANALRDVNASLDPRDFPDDDSCDVRLQVYPDGDWAIRVGDSSYDLDHHGYWGAGCLNGKRFDSAETARDLIDQAREQYADDGGFIATPGVTDECETESKNGGL